MISFLLIISFLFKAYFCCTIPDHYVPATIEDQTLAASIIVFGTAAHIYAGSEYDTVEFEVNKYYRGCQENKESVNVSGFVGYDNCGIDTPQIGSDYSLNENDDIHLGGVSVSDIIDYEEIMSKVIDFEKECNSSTIIETCGEVGSTCFTSKGNVQFTAGDKCNTCACDPSFGGITCTALHCHSTISDPSNSSPSTSDPSNSDPSKGIATSSNKKSCSIVLNLSIQTFVFIYIVFFKIK